MDLSSVAVIAVGLLAFSLISGRLRGTVLTAPLVFVVFGYAIGAGGFAVAEIDPGHGAIHLIAEVTLILVLFAASDAGDWATTGNYFGHFGGKRLVSRILRLGGGLARRDPGAYRRRLGSIRRH